MNRSNWLFVRFLAFSLMGVACTKVPPTPEKREQLKAPENPEVLKKVASQGFNFQSQGDYLGICNLPGVGLPFPKNCDYNFDQATCAQGEKRSNNTINKLLLDVRKDNFVARKAGETAAYNDRIDFFTSTISTLGPQLNNTIWKYRFRFVFQHALTYFGMRSVGARFTTAYTGQIACTKTIGGFAQTTVQPSSCVGKFLTVDGQALMSAAGGMVPSPYAAFTTAATIGVSLGAPGAPGTSIPDRVITNTSFWLDNLTLHSQGEDMFNKANFLQVLADNMESAHKLHKYQQCTWKIEEYNQCKTKADNDYDTCELTAGGVLSAGLKSACYANDTTTPHYLTYQRAVRACSQAREATYYGCNSNLSSTLMRDYGIAWGPGAPEGPFNEPKCYQVRPSFTNPNY